MAKYICKMNRLDWVSNPGNVVRRDDIFELDDIDRATTLLKEGYICLADDKGTFTEVPEITLETDSIPEVVEKTKRKFTR